MHTTAEQIFSHHNVADLEDSFDPVGVNAEKSDDALSLALQRIRLRGYRRVLWQRHLWEKAGQTPAQGMAIPHEEVDAVCLVRWRLAYPKPGEDEPWGITARWTADPRIVGYLSGNIDISPSLHKGGRWLTAADGLTYQPAAVEAVRHLFEHMEIDAPKVAQLVGAEGVGRKTWTARLCAERGQRLLCLDAPKVLTDASNPRDQLVCAEREALLQDCALYWEHADKVPPEVWGEAPFATPLQSSMKRIEWRRC